MQLPVRLLLTTDAVGGVWTYTIDLAEALTKHGVRVMIAALGPAASPAQVTQARATGAQFQQLDAPLDWLADNEQEALRAPHAIAALARDWRADLIQTHSPALIANYVMPAPVVSVIHSCVATWWSAVRGGDMPDELRWRARLVADGLTRAALNVAPSRSFSIAVARAYGGAPPRVVYNARRQPGTPSAAEADFVLSAGRFWDESKDLATLDAAAQRSTWPVVAAGALSSPYGSQVEPKHVVARGALAAQELQALIEQRPIFCSTAVYEPFGLAVLEAAQAGCALVLTAIPTFQELWADAALFAPARDPKALGAALDALARDRDWRAALGEAALQRASQFTPERQARDMLDLYGEALARTGAEAAA